MYIIVYIEYDFKINIGFDYFGPFLIDLLHCVSVVHHQLRSLINHYYNNDLFYHVHDKTIGLVYIIWIRRASFILFDSIEPNSPEGWKYYLLYNVVYSNGSVFAGGVYLCGAGFAFELKILLNALCGVLA